MEGEQEDNERPTSFSNWDFISSDLTEFILSHLPIRSIIRCSAVCKLFRSFTTAPTFSPRFSNPWFFLYGQNNIYLKNNQAFAFDPDSNDWIILPSTLFPSPTTQESSFIGSGGFFFATTANDFSFAPILKPTWKQTPPLRFPRLNPLVGVFVNGFGWLQFIVVGGVKFIGGLVDIEDRLAVEIYNPISNAWDICPPLPADFRSGNSSQSLSSALLGSRFYVFGIYSCFVSSFDLNKRVWSEVQTLRPPGVIVSFLVACENQLVLAGLCNAPRGPSFILWKVDEVTMEFSEVAIMPQDLLYCMFDSDEDDKFASLKCVGLGNVIYVFNEEYHRNYPACVCEISRESGKCSWRRLPSLPGPVNRFHKVITFCSTVSLDRILGGGGGEVLAPRLRI